MRLLAGAAVAIEVTLACMEVPAAAVVVAMRRVQPEEQVSLHKETTAEQVSRVPLSQTEPVEGAEDRQPLVRTRQVTRQEPVAQERICPAPTAVLVEPPAYSGAVAVDRHPRMDQPREDQAVAEQDHPRQTAPMARQTRAGAAVRPQTGPVATAAQA